MQTATARLNNIIMLGCITLAIMAGINHLHGRILYDPKPDVNFQIISIPNFMHTNKWQQLNFRFNLQANLSSLYNWNLKQLYVYIEVQWNSTDRNLSSRAIVYDWIISTPKNRAQINQKYYLSVKNDKLEYNIRDVHKSLKDQTLRVSLNVEYMPVVGAFFKDRLYETTLKVPSNYIQK